MSSIAPAIPVPRGPEGIDADWLTAALGQGGAVSGGRVVAVETSPLGEGHGLLGQLRRVVPTYDGSTPGAPETFVVKLASRSPESVALCEVLGLYARELSFYTRAAGETPLRVPKVFYAALESPGRFALVLEDLGHLRRGDQIAGATAESVRLAVRHIAGHHARFCGALSPDMRSWLPRTSDPGIREVVLDVTAQATERLLRDLPECFDDRARRLAEGLAPAMPALTQSLTAGATTFSHGDYRVDNLLFGDGESEPELAVVDWQIAYETCLPYDVAYLMTQSVEPDVRRAIEHDVLREYHDALLRHGVSSYTLAECREDYRRAAAYCVCYPLIAAGSLDLSNDRSRALATMMLTRALSAAEEADCLGLLRGL